MGLSNYVPSSRVSQAGVCTSSTRPASPYEGQMIYETDTNRVLVYDNTAWVMIADTDTPPGIELVASKTVSAASSLQIDNCFSSTYRDYFFTFSGTSSNTGASDILGRLCTSGTPNTTSNYNALLLYGASTFGWSHYYGATQDFAQMFYGANNRTAANGFIYSPQEAAITFGRTEGSGFGSGSPAFGTLKCDWVFNGTTQFDGIQLYRASATLTGTLTIFGLRK